MLYIIMGTLNEDIKSASRWIAGALNYSGYNADFSLNSLNEVDRFFTEQAENGKPKQGGLLAEDFGSRMFALGSYVGTVLIKESSGTWKTDDNDPEGELNISIVSSSGLEAWPVQKVMKRFRYGVQDSIFHYGCAFLDHSGISIEKSSMKSEIESINKKPGWKHSK